MNKQARAQAEQLPLPDSAPAASSAAAVGKRNTVISICKGIAIILMVMGHADAPRLIGNFIYTFHMPLFFICAGYFFSRRYLGDPWTFIARRVRGLYFPFLKWSIFFLLIHNLCFEIGLLNEQYGNWTGGVTHPYSLRQVAVRLTMMVTGMAGYDEFLAGAFWFFRGLLVASIVFLLLYKYIDSRFRLRGEYAVILICAAAVAFVAFRIQFGIKLTTIPNGGWRETWGVFFFGIGVLYRNFERRIPERIWLTLIYMAFLCTAAYWHFSGMNNGARLRDLWSLPLTGCAGFLLIHHISGIIDRHDGIIRRGLVFIGDNTLYVFIFHILAFKAVSALKIMWYDMPAAAIGSHMVIHEYPDDFFFLLYTAAGVAIPLLGLTVWRKMRRRITLPALKAGISRMQNI